MGEAGVLPVDEVLHRLSSLRRHQQAGKRSPHKSLLVLLALGQLAAEGTSALRWSQTQQRLADLIATFGPSSTTSRAQSAAYPFIRLRTDGIWTLDRDVPMDNVRPLADHDVVGRLTGEMERSLGDPDTLATVARALVDSEFPMTVAPDVLLAVGLDLDAVLTAPSDVGAVRRPSRSTSWRGAILGAWDRQCAFCGFDGNIGSAAVGIDAAHVRWFNFDGPDSLDNGLALCSLHHRLFDRGALGLGEDLKVKVSTEYSARTDIGKMLYELHGQSLHPRPGTKTPAVDHIRWHTQQVFQGEPLES